MYVETRLESLDIIIKGIEEYLNLAESGLKLFKMSETFSMDGASNLESIRIALLNIRKLISILDILESKGYAGAGTERYCNLAEFLRELIMEIKRVNPEAVEKFEFIDETFEPGYVVNVEKMQILFYNIVRIFLVGLIGQKKKMKLKLTENDREFRMEFRGDNTMSETPYEIDRCMFAVAENIAETMGFKCLFSNTKTVAKCLVKIPKVEHRQIALREDTGKVKLDKSLAEIFFCDI